ncbi:Tim44 domain-containing protein [Phenylobacterium sp.]|uniref:Tim44 domain-containing protein n=1 Tax=Phenylobacterium sp. TaxID=1871053 RepID=UPI0030F3AE51
MPPIQRSMTPDRPGATAQAPAAAGAAAQAPRRGGFLGGMGGGILGGLVAGGLLGMFLGNGWGGMGAGMMNTLMQLAILGLGVGLIVMLFRRRRAATAAPAGFARDNVTPLNGARGFEQPASGGFGGFGGGATAVPPAPEVVETYEIGVTQADRDRFEELLNEVQAAFGREDYAALRERTTPEIMSYLSEELSQNATQGRRNEVSDVRLLQADVAEAWREGDTDYATAALRYSSVDVMRDRASGAVLEGDATSPTETTEHWTFTRQNNGAWKLAAIQEA